MGGSLREVGRVPMKFGGESRPESMMLGGI